MTTTVFISAFFLRFTHFRISQNDPSIRGVVLANLLISFEDDSCLGVSLWLVVGIFLF